MQLSEQNMKIFVILGWVSLGLVSYGGSVRAESMSGSDISRLFPGRYQVEIFGRFDLRVNMHANGTITGVAGKYSDTGRWSVENSKLCIAWNTWTKGKKGCSALRKNGAWVSGRGFRFKTT
jgi:hypothetical protein